MAGDGKPDEDRALVDRVRRGDRGAFGQLVRRHQRNIYYLALRYARDPEDARDLAQRAFLRAFQRIHTFRGASSFRTWLYRITVNLALNHVRDRGRAKETQLPADDVMAATGSRLPDPGEVGWVRRAVEELPPKQRLVVELRIWEGMSFREVAEIADCSEDSAKSNFHHALRRLRSMLKGEAR